MRFLISSRDNNSEWTKYFLLPTNTNENIRLLSEGGAHFDKCVLTDGQKNPYNSGQYFIKYCITALQLTHQLKHYEQSKEHQKFPNHHMNTF